MILEGAIADGQAVRSELNVTAARTVLGYYFPSVGNKSS
jgi:hypothetical protein